MEKIEAFYGLPHCTTCQKAVAFLEEHGLDIPKYVDVKTEKVDPKTIKLLAEKVGGVEALFSKRALKYRGMGLHLKTLSEKEMLDLMAEEYTFIKRPVVVTKSGKAIAGFSKKQLEAFIS